MRAGLGVGGNTAGVVIDVGGDEAGTDNREQKGEAAAQAADTLLQVCSAGADRSESVGDGSPIHVVPAVPFRITEW